MKTIFTPAEFIAMTDSAAEFAKELKKAVGINTEKLEEVRSRLRSLKQFSDLHDPEAQAILNELRDLISGSKPEDVIFDDQGNLVMELDPKIVIKVAGILKNNVSSLVGLGIAFYGMGRMLFGTIKSVGKQIEAAFNEKD